MANSKFYIIPDKRTVTSGTKESRSYFLCPSNTVMTGRYHKGDENGQTQYATAIIKIDGKTTTLEEGINSSSIKESSGIWFKTDENRVMTGRHHSGDENGQTYYTSAKVAISYSSTEPAPEGTVIVPDVRTESATMKESGSSFMCPAGTVMTGRTHIGDENGNTQYEYSTLKAINAKGEVIIGSITIEDIEWDTEFDESSGMGYDAPINRVVVGRQHLGDENGKTRYQTGVVLFNGKQATVLSASTLLANVSLKESGGTFFRSASRFILLGRTHTGDENGKTTYYQGYIRIDK